MLKVVVQNLFLGRGLGPFPSFFTQTKKEEKRGKGVRRETEGCRSIPLLMTTNCLLLCIIPSQVGYLALVVEVLGPVNADERGVGKRRKGKREKREEEPHRGPYYTLLLLLPECLNLVGWSSLYQ